MDVKQLRVGNWVSWISNGEPRVNQIDLGWLLKISLGEAEVSPIHLTPDVLVKCGFERGLLWHFLNINESLRFYSDFDNTTCYLFDKQDNCLSKCEYLHQLQNLYFALTGEELEYNEK